MKTVNFARAFLVVALSSASGTALAQTVPAPDQDAQSPAQAEDIIVTAQRRDESLSKTPVAVSIVTSDTLQKAQVRSEVDLRFATPGLQISSGESSNTINLALRGQSQDPSSDTRPGVLPYFNEIPVAGQGFSTAFYDLQSIQVVKGPQGTLFGRSATAGAVLFTTAKPTNTFGGYVSALYGNFDAKQFEGALNVPIIGDTLLARVSGYYSDREGFQRNVFDGSRVGDLERYGVRGSVTLNVSDRLHNTLVFDHFHASGQNTAAVISGLLPVNPAGGPPYFPAQLLYSGTSTPTATLTGQCTLQAIAQFPGGCPPVDASVAAFYNSYFADPNHPNTGLSGVLAAQQARGPFQPNYNSLNQYSANINKLINTTTFDLGSDISLKNIFGYIDSRVLANADVDSSPYGIQDNTFGPQNTLSQYTNELQLSGQAADDRLSYVVGFFYSNERNQYVYRGHFFDLIFGGSDGAYNHILTSKTYAGFAQATYKLTETGLSVTGGLRYTSEKVGKILPLDDNNGAAFCTTPIAGYDCNQTATYKNLNYTFVVQDQVTPNVLLYATTRQAFRNGGFNGYLAPKVGSGASGGDSYASQRVRDVEAGTKFQGSIGGVPARANLALYYSWIDNDQRAAYVLNPGPGATNVNVPKGNVYGLEFDGQIRPARWLTLGGTFNYTHAEYTDGNVVVTTVFGPAPAVYDRFPNTPETSGTLFSDLTIPVTSRINLLVHGDVYYQAKSFTTPRSYNFAGTTISSYALANFRIGFEDELAGLSFSANVNNAFQKTYYTGGFALGEIYQINTLVPGERRTFTASVRYKF